MMNYDGPNIHFSDVEKAGLPNADEILPNLISAAKQCYNILTSINPAFNNHECITHFIHSADCALQVVQHIEREGGVDYSALCETIDIPGIDEILPLLVLTFESFKSELEGLRADYLGSAIFYIALVGTKMYPDGLGERGVQGFRNIFDDKSSGFNSLIRLWP